MPWKMFARTLETRQKLESSLKKAEDVAAQVEKEVADHQEKAKASASKPEEAETSNLTPVEDFDYDQERLMQAPLSAGEREALQDPAYSAGSDQDWLNTSEVYKSPIERALDAPKLQLMRARRI